MKALYRRWLPALLACALLAGCAPAEQGEDGLKLWFTTSAETADDEWAGKALGTEKYSGEATVEGMMAALLDGPEENGSLSNPFPSGTRLLDWNLENSIVQVDLSQQYGSLTGVYLTLADYCITLTLSQLEGVEGVVITVNGSELSYRDRQVLYPEDVVFSGDEEEPVDVSAALYFRRGDSAALGFEQRNFRLTESDVPALAVLRALADGPEDEELTALLPEGLEVYSARTDDGICTVDLSEVFLEAAPDDAGEQALIVYSIVNTLCSLETVESVRFMVEGEEVSRYGQLDLSQPLTAVDDVTG